MSCLGWGRKLKRALSWQGTFEITKTLEPLPFEEPIYWYHLLQNPSYRTVSLICWHNYLSLCQEHWQIVNNSGPSAFCFYWFLVCLSRCKSRDSDPLRPLHKADFMTYEYMEKKKPVTEDAARFQFWEKEKGRKRTIKVQLDQYICII